MKWVLTLVLALMLACVATGCEGSTPGGPRDASASGAQSGKEPTGCHPSYEGACLDPSMPDYDCEGGSGDGPGYTGPVRVVGDDPYGLDRDGDGWGCE